RDLSSATGQNSASAAPTVRSPPRWRAPEYYFVGLAGGAALEPRLADVALYLAPCLGGEGSHVGRVAGGDDHEFVGPDGHVAHGKATGPVGDGAYLPAVEEHDGSADVGLYSYRSHVGWQPCIDRQV